MAWGAVCVLVGCTTRVDLVDPNEENGGGTGGGTSTPAETDGSGGSGGSPPGSGDDESDLGDSDESGSDSACGNGVMDPGEDCDDGNESDADGCNTDCRVSGSLTWSTALGDEEYGSAATLVVIDSEDGIAVAGEDQTFLSSLGWVARLDGDQQLLWREVLEDCTVTRSLAAGPEEQRLYYGCLRPDVDPFVLRTLDAEGSVVETLSVPANPGLIAATPAGTVLLVNELELLEYDDGEPTSWPLQDLLQAIAITPDGGLAATSIAPAGVGNPLTDNTLLKYDDWSQPVEPAWVSPGPTGLAYDLAVDGAGNMVVLGHYEEVKDNPQRWAWLRKLAPDGTVRWELELDVDPAAITHAVAVDSAGHIVLVGRAPPDYYATITKHDGEGEVLWTVTEEGVFPREVAIDSSDQIVVVGSSDSRGWVGSFAP